MGLAAKLQIRDGESIAVLHAPPGLKLDLAVSSADPAAAHAVLVFVSDSATLAERREAFVEAARREALSWVAYPKAGQLGTDLNRDSLARALDGSGVRPVRQVSIDETWSA